jgi:hypothetical protein
MWSTTNPGSAISFFEEQDEAGFAGETLLKSQVFYEICCAWKKAGTIVPAALFSPRYYAFLISPLDRLIKPFVGQHFYIDTAVDVPSFGIGV